MSLRRTTGVTSDLSSHLSQSQTPQSCPLLLHNLIPPLALREQLLLQQTHKSKHYQVGVRIWCLAACKMSLAFGFRPGVYKIKSFVVFKKNSIHLERNLKSGSIYLTKSWLFTWLPPWTLAKCSSLFSCFLVVEMEPRALHTRSTSLTTEQFPQPHFPSECSCQGLQWPILGWNLSLGAKHLLTVPCRIHLHNSQQMGL